jgi:hypothetical protein
MTAIPLSMSSVSLLFPSGYISLNENAKSWSSTYTAWTAFFAVFDSAADEITQFFLCLCFYGNHRILATNVFFSLVKK